MIYIKQRYGKISITKDLLACPKEISEVFAKIGFLPDRIEQNEHVGVVDYYGYSFNFDILRTGDLVPRYHVVTKWQCDESNAKVPIDAFVVKVVADFGGWSNLYANNEERTGDKL